MNARPMPDAEAARWQVPAPDPAYWRMFEEMLDLFQSHGVRVIVNEMEEAPFIYRNQLLREKWRAFMRDVVSRRVREAGFPYVHVDFDRLTDDDYFDYNHLNSRGIAKFATLIYVGAVAPAVAAAPAGIALMLFNTFQYLGFFISVLAIAWLLAGFGRWRIWFLLAASLYFYASQQWLADPRSSC